MVHSALRNDTGSMPLFRGASFFLPMTDFDNASLYARFLRTKATGAGPDFARAQFGPNSRVASLVEKNALGTWSLIDDPDLRAASRGFMSLVRNRSLISKIAAAAGFRNTPFETPSLVQSKSITATWVGEGRRTPTTSADFAAVKLANKKIAALLPVTQEILQGAGSNFESALTAELVRGVAELEGVSFIDPANAGLEGSPSSVTHGVPPIAGTANPKEDIGALLESFTGDLETAVLVARPQAGLSLFGAGYLGAGAKGGDVAGIPLVTSSAVPAGTVSLIDPARILLADDGVVLDLSEHAAIALDDGSMLLLWQENLAAIRAVRHLNWQAQAGAASLVTDAAWA